MVVKFMHNSSMFICGKKLIKRLDKLYLSVTVCKTLERTLALNIFVIKGVESIYYLPQIRTKDTWVFFRAGVPLRYVVTTEQWFVKIILKDLKRLILLVL